MKKPDLEKLCIQLYSALVLTHHDSERGGSLYGTQSNCVKAIKAFERSFPARKRERR